VSAKDGVLIVKAQRVSEHVREELEYKFTPPFEANFERCTAEFKEGTLTLTVPSVLSLK